MHFEAHQRANQKSDKESEALLARFRNETYLAQQKLVNALPTNRAFFASL